MQVYGPVQLHGAQPIGAPHSTRTASPVGSTASGAIQDELRLSEAGQRMADRLEGAAETRQERIGRIRAEIAAGTYETPDKLNAALDRLLDQLG